MNTNNQSYMVKDFTACKDTVGYSDVIIYVVNGNEIFQILEKYPT